MIPSSIDEIVSTITDGDNSDNNNNKIDVQSEGQNQVVIPEKIVEISQIESLRQNLQRLNMFDIYIIFIIVILLFIKLFS